MIRKYAFLLFFLILTVLSFGQDLAEVKKNYLQGVTSLANNDLKSAEESFNRVISAHAAKNKTFDPYIAKSYYFLGDISFIRQDYDKAVDNYKLVARLYYQEDIYSKSLYKLGRTLVMAGRYSEGIAVLEDYIAQYQNKDFLEDHSYYWMGRACAKKNDYIRALSIYQFVLDKYPSSALSFELRNSISTLQGILEEQNSQRSMQEEKSTGLLDLKQKNELLVKEKNILEQMSRLLQIKQRLLEIKAIKVEALARLKEQNEVQ